MSGNKVCPKGLARIIEFANMVSDFDRRTLPPGFAHESFSEETNPPIPSIPFADLLPDAVKLYLIEVMSDPKHWEMSPEEWIAGWEYVKPRVDQARFFLQWSAMSEQWALIRGSLGALTAIVSGAPTIPVTTFLKRGKDGKGAYAGDPISDALIEAEWDYVKRCPICGKFFYAVKITVDAWPITCANALRARRKRASDKLKREMIKKKAKKRGK
jgi:hypothetical protein